MITQVLCGDCNKPLFNVSHPESGETSIKFGQTKCPFCNGLSFEKEFNGKISIGPIGSDESKFPTMIVDTEYVSKDFFIVKVSKK